MRDASYLARAVNVGEFPPVKPKWANAAATGFSIAFHVFIAWLTAAAAVSTYHKLDVTLVPYGDPFGSLDAPIGSREQEAADEETPPPQPPEELADLDPPPATIMEPDPLALRDKATETTEPRKRAFKAKVVVAHAKAGGAGAGRSGGGVGRSPFGLPEGRAPAGSAMDYAALLAIAIRQHTPTTSGLGPGTAHVQFHVNAWGAIVGVFASGSSPAHAALARRIVGSVHAPKPPGGSFFARQEFDFH